MHFVVKFSLILSVLLFAENALAGPGGQIAKGIWYSPVGRILLMVLTLIFLPLAIYIWWRERQASRRALQDLAFVARQAPDFGWLKLQRRILECFHRVHSTWNEGNLSDTTDWMTPWYWQNQQMAHLDRWEREGLRNVCEVQSVSEVRPILFVHQNDLGRPHEGSSVIVSITATMTDFLEDRKTKKVMEGDRKPKEVQRLWTFTRMEGDWKVALIEEADQSLVYAQLGRTLPQIATTMLPTADHRQPDLGIS